MNSLVPTERARVPRDTKSLGVESPSVVGDRCTFPTTKRRHHSGKPKLWRRAGEHAASVMRCFSNVLHTLISSNDLADRLGVSRATVVRAVAKGTLRPALVTPGGHRRFLPQEVEGLEPGLGAGAPALVGSAEAARILGVSQQTVNRAVRIGRLRPTAVTPGGHRRFAVSELEARRRSRAGGEAPT
jgi:excisionase family DNA binding protein